MGPLGPNGPDWAQWGPFGPSKAGIGGLWAPMRPNWAPMGTHWAPLGPIGAHWGQLGPIRPHWGPEGPIRWRGTGGEGPRFLLFLLKVLRECALRGKILDVFCILAVLAPFFNYFDFCLCFLVVFLDFCWCFPLILVIATFGTWGTRKMKS